MKSKGSQFTQLPMFMDAGSLQSHLTGAVDEDYSRPPTQDLWNEKLAESKSAGPDGSLYNKIRRKGVQHPVTVLVPKYDHFDGQKWVMGDGHHRVAAAAEIQRKTGKTMYVPIIHDAKDFMASEGNWWEK